MGADGVNAGAGFFFLFLFLSCSLFRGSVMCVRSVLRFSLLVLMSAAKRMAHKVRRDVNTSNLT